MTFRFLSRSPRCGPAAVLLAALLVASIAPTLAIPKNAAAQCANGVCPGPRAGFPPELAPAQRPATIPGGSLPGFGASGCTTPGGCAGQFDFGPLTGLPSAGFLPNQGLFQQPLSLLQALFRVPVFLTSMLASTIAQQLTRDLFGFGGPDITSVNRNDPRGQRALRVPSLRARRAEPPSPIPGEFQVERLNQRSRVEECPGGRCPRETILPQRTGLGAQVSPAPLLPSLPLNSNTSTTAIRQSFTANGVQIGAGTYPIGEWQSLSGGSPQLGQTVVRFSAPTQGSLNTNYLGSQRVCGTCGLGTFTVPVSAR